MNDKQQNYWQPSAEASMLRKRAEEQARSMEPVDLTTHTPEEVQQILYELQVHQIELTMQNKELRAAQEELEESRARCFELYDLAPVGYLTLSEEGLITLANLTAATLLGVSRSTLLKVPITGYIFKEDQDIYYRNRKKLFESGEAQECELRLVKAEGAPFWACLWLTVAQAEDGAPLCRLVFDDITERKQRELYQELSGRILGIISESAGFRHTMQQTINVIKQTTGVDAVGMRLQSGDYFPWYVQDGFSEDFLCVENSLVASDSKGDICRNPDGSISLEGTCGLVICGKTDPSNLLFTPGGSAWTNNYSSLLEFPGSDDPRIHPRNNCTQQGFASIALIPIRQNQQIVGILQIIDRRKGKFNLDAIKILEGIANHIGGALVRKQAEDDLRESKSIAQEILDNIPDNNAVFQFVQKADGNYDVPFMSNSVVSVFERPIEDLQNPARIFEEIHSDDLPGMWSSIEQSVQDMGPWKYDFRIITETSGQKWIRGISNLKRLDDGSICWTGMLLDITAQRQAEKDLSESEEKHRRLFETMAQGVIYQDAYGRIVSANPAAERILGITLDQMQGRTSMDPYWQMIEEDGVAVPGSGHPAIIALRTGVTVGPVTRGVFHSGKNSHIWLSITAIPLFQPGEEKPFQAYATFTDITELKQAEEALCKKQEHDNLQYEVAETLLTVNEQGPGDALIKVLQRTCEFFAADLSFLFELSPDGRKLISTFLWCNQDKAGQPAPNQNHLPKIENFSWGGEQFNRYGYIHIPDVELLPSEGTEKQELSRLQLKSVIAVPLIVQDVLYGYLAYCTKNEAKIWIEEHIKTIRAIGDKLTAFISRKRLTKEISESYDKSLSVLDSIDALIYVADMETYEIKYINRYGRNLWGDVEGRKCWEALQENQTGPCDFCVNYQLLDENGQSAGIHRWQTKNMVTGRWYEVRDKAISWIDGNMMRLSVAVDITMFKEAEQKVEESRKAAEAANQAKGRFLATISHEIRNPMNVITGMTGMLCEANLAQPLHEYACMAKDSADHLLAIIDDILDFSRMEAGQLEVMPARIKLVREVEKIVSAFSNQAVQKGLELLYQVDGQLPEEVHLDPARLRQVLINLINNAIKFTEKGTVELLVWLEEGESSAIKEPGARREIAFAVKDTGAGIAEKDKSKIFESFSQLEQSKYRGSGGSGLGLAISQNLVKLMGGRIWLESETGKGSTFYFTLPCSVPEEAEAEERVAEKAEEMAEYKKKNLTLLLVEDKSMNQTLAKVFLEQMGHRVEIVTNGREAVEAVKARRYDAVLMDIHLPLMDGLEATKQIRVWEKKSVLYRTAIIAMTAYAMKGDREEFLKAGLDDYISKPVKKEALAESLHKVELELIKPAAGQAEKEEPQAGETFELPDLSAMLERVDGNTELLEELVGRFLEDYHKEMSELEKAISEDDYDKAATIMHGFKGELGNLYMYEAYHLAKELEAMIKSNNLGRLSPTLERLKKSVVKYERYFSQE